MLHKIHAGSTWYSQYPPPASSTAPSSAVRKIAAIAPALSPWLGTYTSDATLMRGVLLVT